MERIIIAGGTGLIGSKLAINLAQNGYEIIVLTRKPEKLTDKNISNIIPVKWDAQSVNNWAALINGSKAIFHLAGTNLSSGRWTKKKKNEFISSRVNATEAIVKAIEKSSIKPEVFVHASGVGYYGSSQDAIFTETSKPGTDFISYVSVKNEDSSRRIEELGVRRIIIRQAPVLSKESIILNRMKLPFQFYLGGPIGTGSQWFPWIHIVDEISALRFLMDHSEANGAFNLVAPQAVTNKQFSQVLGQLLKRPAWFRVPPIMLKIIYGEMSSLILEGQHVLPEKLLQLGFKFQFPDIKSALSQILKST